MSDIDYDRIPPLVMDGMKRYVNDKIRPGHFLTAVIQNNLHEAVVRADEESYRALRDIVGWFYNVPPDSCWGSPKKMEAWLRGTYDFECEDCGHVWRAAELTMCPKCGSQFTSTVEDD